MSIVPDGMRVTARVYGPRPLTSEEQLAIFMKRAEDMLWEQSRASISAWRGMAREHRRSGHYEQSIDVVNINPAPRSMGIEIGSTLPYADLLEEGHGPSRASGKALGRTAPPGRRWPDKKGSTFGKTKSGGARKDAGVVFRKSSGPAKGVRFVPRLMHFTEPALRRRVAASGQVIRDEIVAAMDAHIQETL